MAGKNKFVIPSLEEMETADQKEASAIPRQLFKPKISTAVSDSSTESAQADALKSSLSSPKKRVLSQKALMSMQPLSKQVSQKKSSPTKRAQSLTAHEQMKTMPCKQSAVATFGSSHTLSAVNNINGVTSKASGPGEACMATDLFNQAIASTAQETTRQTSNNKTEQNSGFDEVRFDALPTLAKLGKTNSLLVNPRQKGNPILKYVRSVPWEFGNIVPDYVMGQSNCALFLSLRYHQLHPEYIHTRLKQLGHSFDLRVLLVHVDLKEPHHLVKDLAKICILADCTLMLAFSVEEAGRYLETYKIFENKAAEALMERTETDLRNQVCDCLTRVKSVNRTDCATLMSTFGSVKQITAASAEDLSFCPGFGPQKAKRLHDVFREPFLTAKKHLLESDSSYDNPSHSKSAR
ncbi:DNA excision repair protein ERCC-1-like [Pomacea canaliculata]|uniref:DNA excision repair protein ERCC-1-like n=1 Tax=Pomacea canaliculata TaxID=400727 RepID=UPI000D72F3C2|nr:DNA excision repair protein ERCC-1-like [Pomacea canaliculata]